MPKISVVMSVYNGEARLPQTVESILAQKFEDFEFIIVNDGSTDGSRSILADYERRDRRIRVIDQENRGLTVALVRGCAEARGEFIARQDVGDYSRRARFGRQVAFLESNPAVSLLSCWTQYYGPEDEELFLVEREESPAETTARLRTNDNKSLQGITHHGSAFFRRADYERAGGYRTQFYFAQDLDLWTRLTDFGMAAIFPEVLYCARIELGSLSASHHDAQQALPRIIIELRQARELGQDTSSLLDKAHSIRPGKDFSRVPVDGGHYFIGRLLQQRGDRRATEYLRRAVRASPMNVRARIALTMSAFHSLLEEIVANLSNRPSKQDS